MLKIRRSCDGLIFKMVIPIPGKDCLYIETVPWKQLHPVIRVWWHADYLHDGVIKWKHFPRYWPFVRGIHRGPVNSPHKGQWRGAWMFSLICVWINGWVNNREAGDLRRNRAHYNVTVMTYNSPVKYFGTINYIKTHVSERIAKHHYLAFIHPHIKYSIDVLGGCAKDYFKNYKVIQNKFLQFGYYFDRRPPRWQCPGILRRSKIKSLLCENFVQSSIG